MHTVLSISICTILYTVKLHRSSICKVVGQIDFESKKFFSPGELDHLARDCGFSKRNSKQNKLSGATFFDLIVMNNDLLRSQSLNGLCEELFLRNNIDMKPPSLNERFNEAAVTFLKKSSATCLQKPIPPGI